MSNPNSNKSALIVGYVGMALLQFNNIPAIIQAIETGKAAPIATVLMAMGGLSCYLYNSLKTSNTLYTVGNIIGLVGNAALLVAILVKS